MAISAAHLLTTGGTNDATSYTTGSISPSTNSLILAWVYSIAATAPNAPTASGLGLTWEEVESIDGAGGVRRLTLFRAMGTPTPGTVTFDFGGQTQTGCAWSISEFSGVDTSGTNGSGAIVQAVAGSTPGNATSLTVTLAAFSSVNNATAGGFGFPLNTAGQPTEGSGFSLLGRRNQGTPNLSIGSEYLLGNDTSVDMSSGAASIPWTGIALEIKAASVSPANSGNFFALF